MKKFCLCFGLAFITFAFFHKANRLLAQEVTGLYLQNKTVTYDECRQFYKNLKSQKVLISPIGLTGKSDAGNEIGLYKISSILPSTEKEKVKVLINNNIHAGEPAGVDACMKLVQQLNQGSISADFLAVVDLYIIPAYNVDGMKRRNRHSRANQNGPEEYGFRPGACNHDLNRDMVKGDSRNTFFLREVFNLVQPHLFIDTHISDGADYSYTMTLISTLTQQQPQPMQVVMEQNILPELYLRMKNKGDEICPYVDTPQSTPDSGIVAFNDIARFTTGYAALHNCYGFVTEAHMLKPYPQQVESTLLFLKEFLLMSSNQAGLILGSVEKSKKEISLQQKFILQWEPDFSRCDSILFKGYAAGYRKSEVSGLPVLYYDRNAPWEKKIPYYHFYKPSFSAEAPRYFVIGQEWTKVIEQLQSSGVKMKQISKSGNLSCTINYLRKVEYASVPYEGHFAHRSLSTDTLTLQVPVQKGDWVIEMNQPLNSFIMQVLTPEAPDSYFRWNFFDAVLQQKEWFSDYVFDRTAAEIIKNTPGLRSKLDAHVKEQHLENNSWAQLLFVYRNSDYYESTHLRYPVYRTESDLSGLLGE